MLAAQNSQSKDNSNNTIKKCTQNELLRKNNYKVYKNKNSDSLNDDVLSNVEISLDKYIQLVSNMENCDALDFWKSHEMLFPSLATLAKKYLGVQASSCAVERMFSIAGHIFSVKRRRLGINYFTKLVLLKLNEEYIRIKLKIDKYS